MTDDNLVKLIVALVQRIENENQQKKKKKALHCWSILISLIEDPNLAYRESIEQLIKPLLRSI